MKDRLYERAIRKFGKNNQVMVAMEEMAELTQELSKQERGIGNHDNLVGEMADIYIILEQMKIIYNVSENELEIFRKMKRKRLEGMLNG